MALIKMKMHFGIIIYEIQEMRGYKKYLRKKRYESE